MSEFSKIIRNCLALALVWLIASVSALSPAAAQSDPAAQVFALVTGRMDPARRVQFCAFVARNAVKQSSEAPTAVLSARRAEGAGRLQARLAPHLERANVSLTAADLQRIESENNEYMGLLSHAPSKEAAAGLSDDAANDDFLGLWLADIVSRCNTMLDAMGIAQAPAPKVAGPDTNR